MVDHSAGACCLSTHSPTPTTRLVEMLDTAQVTRLQRQAGTDPCFHCLCPQMKRSAWTLKRRAGRGMAQGSSQSAQSQNSSLQQELAAAANKLQQAAGCSRGFNTACRLGAAQDEPCSKGLPVHVPMPICVLSEATAQVHDACGVQQWCAGPCQRHAGHRSCSASRVGKAATCIVQQAHSSTLRTQPCVVCSAVCSSVAAAACHVSRTAQYSLAAELWLSRTKEWSLCCQEHP